MRIRFGMGIMARNATETSGTALKALALTHLIDLPDSPRRISVFDAGAFHEDSPDIFEPLAGAKIMRGPAASQDSLALKVALIANVFACSRIQSRGIDDRVNVCQRGIR